MDYYYTTTNIIVEYKIEDNDKVFECEFTYDGHHTEEYDIIEEFYNRLRASFRKLKWFKIVNTGKEYALNDDTFDKEPWDALYWVVFYERELTNMERELQDKYKEYLNAKKEYTKCSNE